MLDSACINLEKQEIKPLPKSTTFFTTPYTTFDSVALTIRMLKYHQTKKLLDQILVI